MAVVMILLFSFLLLAFIMHVYSNGQKQAEDKDQVEFRIEIPTNAQSRPGRLATKYKKKRSFVEEFVAFDIETTGLNHGLHEIVQIAAIHFVGNIAVDEFSTYVKPRNSIPASVTKIHGITNAMVRDAPGVSEVLPKFMEFVGDKVLVGHNPSFDLKFIIHELNALDIQLANQVADTLSLSRKYFPSFPNHKLTTVAEKLGVSLSKAHNAVHDTYACGCIYNKCREIASNSLSS